MPNSIDHLQQYKKFQHRMRLQFQLKKVKISPVSHIQINRHAEQLRGGYAIGQLYGALYDDIAHVSNVMAYPDAENMLYSEQLQAMDQRHQQMLNKYNLDTSNIGWYMVSYKQNFWEHLQIAKYNQKCMNTCFFLVYNYEARLIGKNPYKAFRLTDQFCLKQEFNFAEIDINDIKSPFVEIPVEVQKDDIFETLMMFNKKRLLSNFIKNNNNKQKKSDNFKQKIEAYLQTLQAQAKNNKNLTEKQVKQQKNLNFSQYCQNMGMLLKAQEQQKNLRKYQQNINTTQKILNQE